MSDAKTGPSRLTPPRARKPHKATAADASDQAAGTLLETTEETSSPTSVRLIVMPLSVRWRDLDAFNHVNNSKYLSYLEEARLHWMTGLPGHGLDGEVAPVVAAATLNYRRPIGWPGQVMVTLFVERLGNSSVTIGHRITDAEDSSVLYCDGHTVLVWIARQNGRATALPAAVRESCTTP